jgi:hypothetical protein
MWPNFRFARSNCCLPGASPSTKRLADEGSRASSRGLLDQRLWDVIGLRRRANQGSVKADGDAGHLLDRNGPTGHLHISHFRIDNG